MQNTLTEEEIKILQDIKAQGGSAEDGKFAITKYRADGPEKPVVGVKPTQTGASETVGDIKETIRGISSTIGKRTGIALDAIKATPIIPEDGGQTTIETAGQVGAQGVLLFGDLIFEAAKGTAKVFSEQSTEEDADQMIQAGMQKLASIPEVQEAASWYQSQSPRVQRNLAVPIAILELATFKGLGSLTPSIDDLTKAARPRTGAVTELPTNLSSALKRLPGVSDVRFRLSDMPENVSNAISRTTEDNLARHAEIARNISKETTNKTNIEYVGESAEEAYDIIKTKITTANEAKKAALSEVGQRKVTNNPAGTTIDDVITTAGERYGVTVDKAGEVIELPGRVSTLDNASANLLSEYVTKLRQLGVSPTVQKIDDFVDWAQRSLYKQSTSYGQLEAADKAIVAMLKEKTGAINNKLKTSDVVEGTPYVEANADMENLLPMADELSRGLGAEGRKGGAFVKRVFSPSDARTKELFTEIYNETGINLADEATLAKYFMETVGEARGKSLLEEIVKVTESTAELDLTKPGSWLKWLKENIDMDGEELAREVLRRSKEQEANGILPEGTTQTLKDTAESQGVKVDIETKPVEKAVDLEAEAEKALQDIKVRLDESSKDSISEILRKNNQAGFVRVKKNNPKLGAVKEAIDEIIKQKKRLSDDGFDNSQAYKNLDKEHARLMRLEIELSQ